MSPTLDDDPFDPVENNSFDEDLDFDDDDDGDDVFCEGCGLPFDESELDEDSLCPTCREAE